MTEKALIGAAAAAAVDGKKKQLKKQEKDEDEDEDEEEEEDEPDLKSEENEEEEEANRFWVYVLESCASPHYSYVGFTVNRERRLRQHNGELASGGAKYTKQHRPWRMVMSISVNGNNLNNEWWTKNAALQLEWRCKHVSKGSCRSGRKRRRAQMGNPLKRRWKTIRIVNRPAVERRINDIFWLLHNRKKWTRNSPEWKPGRSLRIELHSSLVNLPDLQRFVQECSYWQPSLHPLSIQNVVSNSSKIRK